MRFDRNSIMAPIGRPSSVMGVRPILREPGLGKPERSIFEQPNPFLPPQPPIPQARSSLRKAFDKIRNAPQPILQQPQNPDKTRQGGGILGGADLTGESLRRAYDEERGVLQRPQPIPVQPINVPGGGGINYGIPDSFTPLTGSANERGPIIPPPIDLPPPRPLQPIDRQELKPFVQPIMGKPLVPGSAPPREQTGLTAAELLELSDEELQRYIPKEFIGYGVGFNKRVKDFTPSPEEFREQLQRELNPDPNDPRPLGRRYNLVDQSPQPTQDKSLRALLDIRGTGGVNVPGGGGTDPILGTVTPGGGGLIPPQDFGFGPGVRPSEIITPDGQFIGSAGVTPPDFIKNVENKGPGSLRDQELDRFVPPQDFGLPPLPDDFFSNKENKGPNTFDPPVPITDPVIEPSPTTPDPVVDPVTTPPASMPVGAIDPVLLQQASSETITDPLIRSLYFGTQDQPGFYNQLQQAGANLIGQDVPLQQTAGLTPLEVLARQQAIAGIGGFEPFLQQNQNLVNQAIDQSRRAEALRDPYYGRAERQMQIGVGEELQGIGEARGITTGATDRFGGSLGRLGRQAIGSTQDYGGSLGESEDLLRGTLGAYDPGMTQQFYNPFEDAVVQQTIDDVLEAGDKQDIAARAREISSGAFGGSRARLGAQERRRDLGEGLAKALGGIRQTGFTQAQQTGLSEFARQRAAERAASSGLAGLFGSRLGAQQQLGTTLRGLTGDQFGAQQQLAANLMGYGAAGSGARQNLASGLLGIGQQRGAGASALGSQLAGYGSQIGGIGLTQEQMRAGQRGELAGFGGVGRGIQETGLGRIYQQQLGQQQRPLGVLGQIGSMLPGYQASRTQIDSQYGMPTDPTAAGLGAAFSAYGALAPRQGSS